MQTALSRRRVVQRLAWLGVIMGGTALAACRPGAGRPGEPQPQGPGEAKLIAMLRPSQQELDILEEIFRQFEAKYPSVKVERVVGTGDAPYDDKTDALIAAGTPPALWFPAANRGYRFYAARGLTQELDSLINRDKFELSDFYAGPLEFCKWNGKYNCLPIDVWPQILVFNKTLFDTDRVPYPGQNWQDRSWNWERFLQAAQALTKREADRTVQFGAVMNTGRFAEQIFGGDWFDAKAYETGYPDPARFPANQQAVIDALQFLADLIYRYRVHPTSQEAGELRGTLPNIFLTGRVGMMSTTNGFFPTGAQITGFKWGVAAMPAPPSLPRLNWFFADQWVIMKGQQNLEAAWLLLKHMESPEMQRLKPLQLGALPARKSLSPEWVTLQKSKTGLTDADLQVVVDAVPVSRITPSHALVEYAKIWSDAINPEQQKLFRGETTAKQAVEQIVPLALNIIRQTNPR